MCVMKCGALHFWKSYRSSIETIILPDSGILESRKLLSYLIRRLHASILVEYKKSTYWNYYDPSQCYCRFYISNSFYVFLEKMRLVSMDIDQIFETKVGYHENKHCSFQYWGRQTNAVDILFNYFKSHSAL